MSRRPANVLKALSMAVVAAWALTTACSGPKHDAAEVAPPPPAPVETPAPAPSQPTAAPQVAAAPAVDRAPTPAETPVPVQTEPAPPTTEPGTQPATPEPDALKWLQEREARRVEYEQQLTRLEADRDAAKGVLAQSERDLLALKNPYLARPKLTPEEAAQIQGKNGIERVKWAEDRVANAQAALDAAQKAYDDAKANPPPE